MISHDSDPTILRDLGNGLIVRRGTLADTEKLVRYYADVFRWSDEDSPNEAMGAWACDLLGSGHPTVGVGDFTVVEDRQHGAIVSALVLISQTWAYSGISFGVGRIELVATHPEYRRRGLVRAQMEIVHQWSKRRGHKVQVITGIPWYYRQFGYELALSDGGGRAGYQAQLPILAPGVADPYHVRPATVADLPFLAQRYRQGASRSLVTCLRDEALWRYELQGRNRESDPHTELRVIEKSSGELVGFLAHPASLRGSLVPAIQYELKPGSSWLAVSPSVIRYLWATGQEYARRVPTAAPCTGFGFWLGTEHPVYQAMAERLPHLSPPYAFYLRVADLPDFLQHIAPVLERRLAASVAAGYSGELKLSFYRDGLRFVFEHGRLLTVEQWHPRPRYNMAWPPQEEAVGDAGYPAHTFLQVLFGYRSQEELEGAFADVWSEPYTARVLLHALFPRQPSHFWPVF
jgi:GNAT superfamily N-acetyltransferase